MVNLPERLPTSLFDSLAFHGSVNTLLLGVLGKGHGWLLLESPHEITMLQFSRSSAPWLVIEASPGI